MFKYQIHPVSIKYKLNEKQIYPLIVQVNFFFQLLINFHILFYIQILAVIGGIFSVLGMINSMTQGVIDIVKKIK